MITTAVNPLLPFGLQYLDGTGGYPQVNTYADLPDPVINAGLIYVTLTSTGIYILNRKEAGMYYSDGASWSRLGNIPSFFSSNTFQIYDGSDSTKQLKFNTASIGSGAVRTIFMPNFDVNLGATLSINGVAQDFSTNRTWQTGYADTGALTYGGMSIATATTVNVGAFTGWVIDNETNPAVPTKVFINYPGASGVTVPTIATGIASYLRIISNGSGGGTLSWSNTIPTATERKTGAYVSKVSHPMMTSLSVVANEVDYITSPMALTRALFRAVGYVNGGVNTSGVASSVYPYASAATLAFATTSGSIVGNGINFVTNNSEANTISYIGTLTTAFFKRDRFGNGGAGVTVLDPTVYDNGSGTPVAIGGGTGSSTIQWVFAVPFYSGGVPIIGFIVQYGQTVYSSLAMAIQSVGKESFVVYPTLIKDAILLGVWVLNKTATDLTDTSKAQFFKADKFGQIVGASGGSSVSTMQNTYTNSGVTLPKITTTTAGGAVLFQCGSAANTDTVFGINNIAGTTAFSISGFGVTTVTRISADTSGTVLAKNITGTFNPTSGNAAWQGLLINPTYNQTSTANGTVKGIYYAPILTSVLGTHNAFESTSGHWVIGGTSQLQANQSNFVIINSGGNIQAACGGGTFIASGSGTNMFTTTNIGSTFITRNITDTSGTFNNLSLNVNNQAFQPSSGTATYTSLFINPTYNQTSTANGTVRGVYYAPTVTSVLGTHYCWESTSGDMLVGGTGVIKLNNAGTPTTSLSVSSGILFVGTSTFTSVYYSGPNANDYIWMQSGSASYNHTAQHSIQISGTGVMTISAASISCAQSVSMVSGGVLGNMSTLTTSGTGGVSGTNYTRFSFADTFNPTAGSGTYIGISIGTTINQTSTANGTVRGVYYNPTTTSVLGTHNCWESTSGNMVLGGNNTVGLYLQNGGNNPGVVALSSTSAGTLKVGAGFTTVAVPNLTASNQANITMATANATVFSSVLQVAANTYGPTTSGAGSFASIIINSIIGQTGSANQTIYGIYYNPSGTILGTHYCWNSTSGDMLVGGTGRILINDTGVGRSVIRLNSAGQVGFGDGGSWTSVSISTAASQVILNANGWIMGLGGTRTIVWNSSVTSGIVNSQTFGTASAGAGYIGLDIGNSQGDTQSGTSIHLQLTKGFACTTGTGNAQYLNITPAAINQTSAGVISLINLGVGTITNMNGSLYGLRSQIASGTNTWNIYADGTADNGFGGNVKLLNAGNGIYIKEGTNATMGVATLAAGTVTVSTTKVTANSRIQITVYDLNGSTAIGRLDAFTITAGTSFVVVSRRSTTATETGDTSKFTWQIIEPA